METFITELVKLGGGYILAAVGYYLLVQRSKDWIKREQEIAEERVRNEQRFTNEARELATQYKNDRDCLLAVVQQNTAALTRLEAAFDNWSKTRS